MASDHHTGIYISNPRLDKKAVEMWRFNRGGNRNANANTRDQGNTYNKSDEDCPKHDEKRQRRGEYSIKTKIDTVHSKQKIEEENKQEDDTCKNQVPTKNEAPRNKIKINDANQSTLMAIINEVLEAETRATSPIPFKFENTQEAAKHNDQLLKKHNYDMAEVLRTYDNTVLHPGTEFRHVEVLRKLLGQHKDWPKLEKIITTGIQYGFRDDIHYSESQRTTDIKASIQRGNNKSALDPIHKEFILKNYTKEVERGWMLPIPKTTVQKMKGGGVIPIGIATQHTVNEQGNRIEKHRLTHDCSNVRDSGWSVNTMVNEELLEPCIYGHCLWRLLHHVHKLRLEHTQTRIYVNKTDLDAAFRRLHVFHEHAMMCMTIVGVLGYILGRCPFGTNEGPGKFGIASEIVMDLAQEIADDPTWKPDQTKSPHYSIFPEVEKSYNDDTPFGKAMPLLLPIPVREIYIDGFVDDIMTIVLDSQKREQINRAKGAVPLALHTVFRPTYKDEPVKRDDILSLRKMYGEGALSEVKIVLGWLLDLRKFLIKLP